jgi:glycine hydroxymethyltransferase
VFAGELVIEEIISLVKKHTQWRLEEDINLIPSENVTSPSVRALLSSDLGHRCTSPDRFYMGTRFIDDIQQCGEQLATDLFKCETADLRPLSGHVADVIFLACFTKPKDRMICVSPEDGGYPGIYKHGVSDILGLKTLDFPFSKTEMNIKTDKAEDLILKEKPRLVIFGASLFLSPHPVRELAKVAKEVEADVCYDGSHVLGLIAGKQFQDPLREGASTLLGSTHKSFFGPQGGIILADKEHGEVIKKKIFPAFVDNPHWNRIAALALALAEMKEFGREYAMQVVKNAQTLARTLADYGFPVASSSLGFTRSHQVYLNYGGFGNAGNIAKKLEKANIITDCGVRLGTCEMTRRGMKQKEMLRIAEFIKRVIVDGEQPSKVKPEVTRFAGEFREVGYCFK